MVKTGKKGGNRKMKRSLLRLLPLMAAVTLATSCSKDDDTNAPKKQQIPVSQKEQTIKYNPDGTVTIPYSIKYSTGKSLDKKMTYSDDGMTSKYVPTEGDEIKVSGEGVSGTLTLQNELSDFGVQEEVFKGNLTATNVETATKLTNNKITLTYEYGTALENPASSNVSLKDLMESCNHLYTAEGNYSDKEFTLTDQNAYLAISMSPCCEHILQFNDDEQQTFTVQDGRIWIAIPSDKGVTIEDITIKKLNGNSSTGNSGDDNSTGNSGETNVTTFTGFKITKSADEIAASTIYSIKRQYFTVSSDKKVYFSKGNLQYHTTDKQWRFAEHQWDIVGGTEKAGTVEGCTNDNVAGPWIDLFGWGMWLNYSSLSYNQKKFAKPLNTSTSTSDYPSQAIYNNGTTAIGKEWVVLQANDNSNDYNNEWKYLFKDTKFGSATIEGITGVVVLPDDWETPVGITFNSGYGVWSKNQYDEDQWKIMEAAGAVFLPNAGQRLNGTSFSTVNGPGYWSSTSKNNTDVYYYSVTTSQGTVSSASRDKGKPVRLVRVLN